MSDAQHIKDAIDAVDFVGEYVKLKPAGINHKGLCPFHNEKSPSFMVNRERQRWHCFGCQKGGDIFTFLEELEGMEFVEALKFLADRAGVELSGNTKSEVGKSEKNRLKEVNQAAARFFHNFLIQMDAAKPARDYIAERGLSDQTIEQWQIGYVPEQWDLLTKYLLKKGHGIEDLVAAGMTIKRDGANTQTGRGFYDRFRDRVMFPIRDVHGNTVGFTGRVLVETEKSGGKYVNTPQTPVYDKSRVVFGLYHAKRAIREKDEIVMVEGQMDVIACHQAGMNHVVATSGTALTEEQIKLLKRYSDNLKMAFDADSAGIKAAKRGIELALAAGMHVKVIHIPDGKGKDPDECLQQDPAVWFQAVEEAQAALPWLISMAEQGRDKSDPREKQEIVDEVMPFIARIVYAVERDHWLRELAGRVQVDTSVLHDDMGRFRKEKTSPQTTRVSTEQSNAPERNTKKRAQDTVIEEIIALLVRVPGIFAAYSDRLKQVHVDETAYAPLYETISFVYTGDTSHTAADVRAALTSDSARNLLDDILMQHEARIPDLDAIDTHMELEQLLARAETMQYKQERQELQRAIQNAEKTGDHAALQRLLDQFRQLNS